MKLLKRVTQLVRGQAHTLIFDGAIPSPALNFPQPLGIITAAKTLAAWALTCLCSLMARLAGWVAHQSETPAEAWCDSRERPALNFCRLHLVLTYHWYDEIDRGAKRIEYRAMSDRWRRQIWDCRHKITHVRFARGYTSTMRTFLVEKIDIGKCPIDGWDGDYYRIHFCRVPR